jgi:hypothetical protein
MKLYSGIDLHSNNSVIYIIDEQGNVLFKKRVTNDLAMILTLLQLFLDRLVGLVVESTYNWYWLVDGLVAAGFKVNLANTAAIQQYSGLKHGDDDSAAKWLAEMLRLSILPTGYIYPKEKKDWFVTYSENECNWFNRKQKICCRFKGCMIAISIEG